MTTTGSTTRRSIRSYVRRSGRLTPGQKKALVEYWPLYGLDLQSVPPDIAGPGGAFDAVKLEIGFGSGEALVSMAEQDPNSLYLGIEVHQSGVGRCLNSIHERSLVNVRLMCEDAIEVLQSMLPSRCLDRVFLFFPDPWHKKRHHKRRIVNQQFRDLLADLLKPGACLHMATDWQDYAEYMAQEFLADARFINCGDARGYVSRPAYRPQTRFENRGLKLGHGVWDLLFELKASDQP